jgi:DNA repair protein RadC
VSGFTYPNASSIQFPLFGLDTPAAPAAVREVADRYAADPGTRISEAGASVLSNAELLVVVAGMPHEKALELLRDGIGQLAAKSVPELVRMGLTKRQARHLVASLETGKRLVTEQFNDRYQIRSPADAATMLMVEMSALDQEVLRVVLLDTKNRVQQTSDVYRGSVNSAQIRVGEVFKEAVRRNSAALIVCHNHPSGDPTPSPEDILVTRQIVEAGKLLDCEVLDHLVIGKGRYVSMRERGLGFTS